MSLADAGLQQVAEISQHRHERQLLVVYTAGVKGSGGGRGEGDESEGVKGWEG